MVGKGEMKFCKKCHKVVIKVVTKDTNLDRMCVCDGAADILVSVIQTIRESNASNEDTRGSRKRVNKLFTDMALNTAFLSE